jgi:hypothetical protein
MSMTEQQDTNLTVAFTPAYKRKNEEAPVDVKEVRRSRRIAVIAAGYKDKNVVEAALAREAEKDMQKNNKEEKEKGKKKATSKMTKNLSHEFEADVIDKSAPPPPELHIKTIQAIAVDQCQIPPSEVSEEKLLDKSGWMNSQHYFQQLGYLLYSLVILSYISDHFATPCLRTLFTHVISTSCALNYVTYVSYISYIIYDDYIGHVYDHLFYIMCDVAIISYGSTRTNPIRNFYMEIVFYVSG